MDVESTDSAYYETYNSCQDSNKAIRVGWKEYETGVFSLKVVLQNRRSLNIVLTQNYILIDNAYEVLEVQENNY